MTTATAIAHIPSAMPPATILGSSVLRIPTAGKIRAGIQVLTRAAAANPTAKAIYDQGVGEQISFKEIARRITAAVPALTNPLAPLNVPYFTVRPGDFPNPATAQQILDLYGEDRGQGRRLYRFPVVFAADAWQTVMPHELVCWGASGRKFWSEYSSDGRTRYCMTYAPATMNPKNRAVRVFGGRRRIPRADTAGVCNPESCPEYQYRQCNLSGRFVFYIPGIKSISAVEIPTNSFYAMNEAKKKFEAVGYMRGGRIAGFLDADRTPFYITKQLRDMPHIDDDGKPVRVKQWVVELEAPVDVAELLLARDDATLAITQASRAARLLEAAPTIQAPAMEPSEAPQVMEGDFLPAAEAAVETGRAGPGANSAGGAPDLLLRHGQLNATELPDIQQLLTRMQIDPAAFLRYADQRYGAGWKLNENGRRRIKTEIERHLANPQVLIDLIAAQ